MKIAYVSEQPFFGIPDEGLEDLRADISWMKTLNLFHISFPVVVENMDLLKQFDIVILNHPKNYNGLFDSFIPHILEAVIEPRPKIGIIQHGSYDYFMVWNTEIQSKYIEALRKADFFIITNEIDENHFRLIAPKTPILFLKTDLDDIIVQKYDSKKREDKVMISGNLTSWYAGTMSLLVAEKLGVPITMPNMGKRQDDEARYVDKIVAQPVTILPYLKWTEWFKILSTHKYAVNMMPVAACGSFSVACAALGIPCIGRKHITAQEICFPELSIDERYENIDDKIALVKSDYERLSKYAREQFLKHFERQVVKQHFYEQLEKVMKK